MSVGSVVVDASSSSVVEELVVDSVVVPSGVGPPPSSSVVEEDVVDSVVDPSGPALPSSVVVDSVLHSETKTLVYYNH